MKHLTEILESLSDQLRTLAQGNAVVAKTVTVGDKHLIPLCQLSMGMGAGGGMGEGEPDEGAGYKGGKGVGGGAGGGAKVAPMAILVVEGDKVRLETLEG